MWIYIVTSYHPSYGTSFEKAFTIRKKAEEYVQQKTDKQYVDYRIIETFAI
jgi:hypothetical protein